MTLLVAISCHGDSDRHTAPFINSASLRVSNLRAFARLYGVVRWFHPSDAASTIDWDRFAVDGVRRVIDAPDRQALRAIFAELMLPIAPTVQIATKWTLAAKPAVPNPAMEGLELVAWEHRGYGDSTLVSEYASKRRHRGRLVTIPGMPFASLCQTIDATPFRGTRVRLRGKIRTRKHGLGRMWLRVDRNDKQRGFFDNMREHPVASETWSTGEIVGTVAADAAQIAFGVIVSGGGTVWYDDIELSTESSNGVWVPIAIADRGFESADLFASWIPGTGGSERGSIDGWHATLDRAAPAAGGSSLRVEAATKIDTAELFAEAPNPGETVDVDLGQDLYARVPVSLYSKNGHTIGDDAEIARRSQTGPSIAYTEFDPVAGVADLTVVWSVMEHFWPYWDAISVDWNAALDRALTKALGDRSIEDHVATLQRLTAIAADGHTTVTCAGTAPRARAPFAVDLVEGQIVVTATTDKNLARGDVIVLLDGRAAIEQLLADAALISGSRQWQLSRALEQFGGGAVNTTVSMRVRRGAVDLDVRFTRGSGVFEEFSHPPIEHLQSDIYYVDLGRASMAEIDAVVNQLASASGVIFDLRGYPNSNHGVLSYLITHDINTAKGMTIPHIIRPGHTPSSVSNWETANDRLTARRPHIGGRVAFLTGPGAISYAETVMAQVEYYRLGAIVGSATAGTNGNKAEITAPTGCRVSFTALRVTKPDGAQLHLVGVQPTIQVLRTISGVVAGKDEVLERAIAYVRGSQ